MFSFTSGSIKTDLPCLAFEPPLRKTRSENIKWIICNRIFRRINCSYPSLKWDELKRSRFWLRALLEMVRHIRAETCCLLRNVGVDVKFLKCNSDLWGRNSLFWRIRSTSIFLATIARQTRMFLYNESHLQAQESISIGMKILCKHQKFFCDAKHRQKGIFAEHHNF